MPSQTFIFECSSSTCLVCFEKNLFDSNKPWPLEIKTGDYCLLHHFEIGGLLGLWQATCDDGQNLVAKVWGGKFPYQARVKLVMPKATDVPKKLLSELGVNPARGRLDNCVDEDMAEGLIRALMRPNGPCQEQRIKGTFDESWSERMAWLLFLKGFQKLIPSSSEF